MGHIGHHYGNESKSKFSSKSTRYSGKFTKNSRAYCQNI